MTTLWTRAGLTWRGFALRLWRPALGRRGARALRGAGVLLPVLGLPPAPLPHHPPRLSRRGERALRWNLFWLLARISPSDDVTELLNETLNEITARAQRRQALAWLAAAVWVASNGMLAVSRTLNRACGLKETRPWWRRRLMAIVLTVGFSVLIIGALGLIFYGGAIAEALAERWGSASYLAASGTWCAGCWCRFLVLSFEMVYNYAPNLGRSAREPRTGGRRARSPASPSSSAPRSASATISPTSSPTPRPTAPWGR